MRLHLGFDLIATDMHGAANARRNGLASEVYASSVAAIIGFGATP